MYTVWILYRDQWHRGRSTRELITAEAIAQILENRGLETRIDLNETDLVDVGH